MSPEGLPEPLEVAVSFTRVLDDLGVPYFIGGSLASSVHGEPRATNDIDIVAALRSEQVAPLVAAVRPHYYVSTDAARDAVRNQGSFNLIHLHKAVKVDLFVAGTDALNTEGLRIRRQTLVWSDPETWLFIDTPEHSILRKLEWYRRGGEVSERQWHDVLSMMRVQGDQLDQGTLDAWAPRLNIADLLERARVEVV